MNKEDINLFIDKLNTESWSDVVGLETLNSINDASDYDEFRFEEDEGDLEC